MRYFYKPVQIGKGIFKGNYTL